MYYTAMQQNLVSLKRGVIIAPHFRDVLAFCKGRNQRIVCHTNKTGTKMYSKMFTNLKKKRAKSFAL